MENMDMLNDMENTKENSEKIGEIWKIIVNWFGKYGRKASRIAKRFGKYRKLWKDIKSMEEK